MKIGARGYITLGLLLACLLKGGHGHRREPHKLPDLVIAAR